MPISRTSSYKAYTKALLCLARLHSAGAGALADAVQYPRPNLTQAAQGLRALPPLIAQKMEALLNFGPDGFDAPRVTPALCRIENPAQVLAEAGFAVSVVLQIVPESRATEPPTKKRLMAPKLGFHYPFGEDEPASHEQVFSILKLSYQNETYRYLVMRGAYEHLKDLYLSGRSNSIPFVLMPPKTIRGVAGEHFSTDPTQTEICARLLSTLDKFADGKRSAAGLQEVRDALVELGSYTVYMESRKTPDRDGQVPVGLIKPLTRIWKLEASLGSEKQHFSGVRQDGQNVSVALIVIDKGVEFAGLKVQSSRQHLLVLDVLCTSPLALEVVYDGPYPARSVSKGIRGYETLRQLQISASPASRLQRA